MPKTRSQTAASRAAKESAAAPKVQKASAITEGEEAVAPLEDRETAAETAATVDAQKTLLLTRLNEAISEIARIEETRLELQGGSRLGNDIVFVAKYDGLLSGLHSNTQDILGLSASNDFTHQFRAVHSLLAWYPHIPVQSADIEMRIKFAIQFAYNLDHPDSGLDASKLLRSLDPEVFIFVSLANFTYRPSSIENRSGEIFCNIFEITSPASKVRTTINLARIYLRTHAMPYKWMSHPSVVLGVVIGQENQPYFNDFKPFLDGKREIRSCPCRWASHLLASPFRIFVGLVQSPFPACSPLTISPHRQVSF